MLKIRGRRRRSRSGICYAVWPLGELRSRRPGFTGWVFPSEEQVASANGASRTTRRSLLALTPDIYIRDFVGDSGESRSGPINASPGITLRKVVADAQAAFGQCSGREMNATLGYEGMSGSASPAPSSTFR